MMTFEEFKTNVEGWASERGIYEYSTPQAQLLKMLSELGELADAVIKDDHDGFVDAIGDMAVCLVNYAAVVNAGILLDHDYEVDANQGVFSEPIGLIAENIGAHLNGGLVSYEEFTANVVYGLQALCLAGRVNFLVCCAAAWLQIKDRKGRMVAGGAFVKEGY